MTMTNKAPRAPAGLQRSGRALWRAVQDQYELEEHEAQLLREMCRTADQLDTLQAIVDREGPLDPETGRVHPAGVEARQLRITFARLSAALRLPAGDEDDAQQRRPQRRVGVRGTYGIRGAVS
jgi:hypothetical protein